MVNRVKQEGKTEQKESRSQSQVDVGTEIHGICKNPTAQKVWICGFVDLLSYPVDLPIFWSAKKNQVLQYFNGKHKDAEPDEQSQPV